MIGIDLGVKITLEATIFIFGVVSVLYSSRQNILVYPTGLVATILSVYLMYRAAYYADMAVNIYYTIMSFYGWIVWEKTVSKHETLAISYTNGKEKKIGILFFMITLIVLYGIYSLFRYDLKIENYLDILSSGIFFTGMWYMATKKIENWIFWMVGNTMCIPLMVYRELYIIAVQYFVFTILAIYGFRQWKRSYKETQKNKEIPQ